jgi:hypothetical protein
MKLSDLVTELGLQVRTAKSKLDGEVTGGYASDLVSDVLGNTRQGNLWITLQRHENIVAAAVMRGLVGIILVGGREPEEDTAERAEAEDIPILVSELPAFELIGRLYQLGVRGGSVE